MINRKEDRRFEPPFFEVGPKAYLYGEEFVELAKFADQLSKKYDVRIVATPQYVDIPIVAKETENIFVFAQHMDSLRPGRGLGSVLPEALKAAGADGTFLNHAEKRISIDELEKTIPRAKEVGLMTIVCADNMNEALFVAKLAPTLIVVESPDMIASGKKRDESEYDQIIEIEEKVHAINPEILLFHGAGISNAQDVYDVIASGAIGTGSSSALFLAEDRYKMLEDMIRSVHEAWTKNKKGERK